MFGQIRDNRLHRYLGLFLQSRMPLPDVLPVEIWHRILTLGSMGGFWSRDYKAMMAVAPQTVAKGMHDAAFEKLFSSLHLSVYDEEELLE